MNDKLSKQIDALERATMTTDTLAGLTKTLTMLLETDANVRLLTECDNEDEKRQSRANDFYDELSSLVDALSMVNSKLSKQLDNIVQQVYQA